MRDSFADIAALAEVDLAAQPTAYSEAMRHAYYEDKDLSAAMAIAWAGISRLLAMAHDASPERAHELRSQAKALSYDLASFTWAGWDEPGIVITPPEARAGCAAARANLALATELEKGELPRSRAHWILGAHELAAGRPEDARADFEAAVALARAAGDVGLAEARLSRAFVALADMAAGTGSEHELEAALSELRADPDGAALVEQVKTARSALAIGT
ncbi:MAG: hypothetical protein AB1Z67_05615 [Candidatus Limnocylindrales bacterium]